MRNDITYKLGLSIVICLLLPSCNKVEYFASVQESDEAIAFSLPQVGTLTKGVDPLQDTTLVNFGIGAVLNYDGVSENQWYLSQQPVVRDELTRKFNFNPPAYWPVFGDLSFFAYAPKFQNGSEEIPFVETTTGFPTIEFTPSTNVTGQIDFCVGRPLMHKTRADNPISIKFEHALTQIMFYVNYTGVIPQGYFMLITEMTVKNVVGTKSVSFSTSDPYFAWEGESAHTADSSYVLQRIQNHIRTDSIRRTTGLNPDTYYPLSNSPGRLYLLPQTLGPDAKLEVKYGFYYNYGADPQVLAMFVKEVPLPEGQVWPGGKTVNYQMTVDVGISSPIGLTSTISDWEPSGNTHAEFEFE